MFPLKQTFSISITKVEYILKTVLLQFKFQYTDRVYMWMPSQVPEVWNSKVSKLAVFKEYKCTVIRHKM